MILTILVKDNVSFVCCRNVYHFTDTLFFVYLDLVKSKSKLLLQTRVGLM